MQFADYPPPSAPTLGQQRDALQQGLGRAMQWAIQGRLDDGPLLEACLSDLRHDAQVEDSRGDWLWGLIQRKEAADRFQVPILHALYHLEDDRSGNQLCELAGHYAEAGDETFRLRLYEIVEQKPFTDGYRLGETEIVRLDGEEGFLFAARVRGQELKGRDWDWDDSYLVEKAIDRFGEGRVNFLLEQASGEAIGRFLEVWRQRPEAGAERDPYPSHRERMRAIPLGDILLAAESSIAGSGLFRGWGMYADEADLEVVLQHLWPTREPTVIANLLKVFSNRVIPRFDARLIQYCRHDDPEVRRWAFNAMELNSHCLLRELALAELDKAVNSGSWSDYR